jgi:alpha-ribazole phosphatase
MEMYLVRHTITVADKTVCYGQTDVPVDTGQFKISYPDICKKLPEKIDTVYSSQLIRCSILAQQLVKEKYTSVSVTYDNRLKELNFGDWEMKKWDDINKEALGKWMQKFTTEKVPCGESNADLHERVVSFWNEILSQDKNCCIITHAGVMRSILSIINKSELQNAFALYPVKYGDVIKITRLDDCSFKYTLLEAT